MTLFAKRYIGIDMKKLFVSSVAACCGFVYLFIFEFILEVI